MEDALVGEWLRSGWVPQPGHRVRTPHGTVGIVLEAQGTGYQRSSARRLRVYTLGGGVVWLRGPVQIWAVRGRPVRFPLPAIFGPVIPVAPFRFEILEGA